MTQLLSHPAHNRRQRRVASAHSQSLSAGGERRDEYTKALLRDIAFVLKMAERVRDEMEAGREAQQLLTV